MGTSIAALFNASLLMLFLRRRLDGIEGRRVAGSLIRIAAAAAMMGVAAAGANMAAAVWLPGLGLGAQIARLLLAITAALGVLAAAAYGLRIREFHDGVSLIARRFRMTRR